ncbi:MAG TPA: anhydro-N-acetylmuramic acid kinase [Nitrospirota bacterium]
MSDIRDIARKKSRIVVGLMSGTSHDGVDAVVARVFGTGAKCRTEFIGRSFTGYPKQLRDRIRASFDGPTALVCSLDFELGEVFAKAALKAVAEAGLTPAGIDIIGSHGQTICHIPPAKGRPGSTLQIGQAAVIAKRTGVLTVSDFRTADVAAGGHGAPLVPYADWVLFRQKGKTIAIQNIGGMANVTIIGDDPAATTGFDTGPGGSLIDDAAQIFSGGKSRYDRDGRLGRSGKLIPEMLRELQLEPYFKKKPPRTTGRELFGREMVQRLVAKYQKASKEDIIRTLTELTAWSVRDAYERFVFPKHNLDRLVLAGGGARNGFLVSLITERFPEVPVLLSDELGIPAEAREALCFAVLANETVCGTPSNVPAATGAKSKAILGKISFP